MIFINNSTSVNLGNFVSSNPRKRIFQLICNKLFPNEKKFLHFLACTPLSACIATHFLQIIVKDS